MRKRPWVSQLLHQFLGLPTSDGSYFVTPLFYCLPYTSRICKLGQPESLVNNTTRNAYVIIWRERESSLWHLRFLINFRALICYLPQADGLLLVFAKETSSKGCGAYVVTLLNYSPIFEWYMARLVVKSRHQKDIICFDEVGLCTLPYRHHSRVNSREHDNWEGQCDCLKRTRIFTLTSYRVLHLVKLLLWRNFKWPFSWFIVNENWMSQFLIQSNGQIFLFGVGSAHNRAAHLTTRGSLLDWNCPVCNQ